MESLLVANRGEIACRIFRSARRMGMRTIAVFSDADAGARHVREADEAIRIGPPAPRESYLDIARILQAARRSGARAIHPGYGFLSENAQFSQACADAGLSFVGPPASAIGAMGSKIVAKARMRAAGVPVLPGYEGDDQSLEALAGHAARVGLPLIIKPAAGGGGKGMRIVRDAAEIPEALAAARRLAESGFGDGSLLLERFLAAPRHVEVQIFADTHGNYVHLGDRDCSVQRRHQKLIEEAPAPDLPEALRSRLRAAALVVAREIGYVSAGTVEFLYDGREFYFMEMNTRLQVEHTVTEAVTGLDLVEWQLRVARGERLPLSQDQIRLEGHAIEARVCAEDPERDFLPSAGVLDLMQWPSGASIRVDAGFDSGDRVPDTYDSLLGKVIAWAPTRAEAAQRLQSALENTYSAGVRSNEHWLARVLRTPEFLHVRHSIAFLQEHADQLRTDPAASADNVCRAVIMAAVATLMDRTSPETPANPWDATDGFQPNLPAKVQAGFRWHAQSWSVELESRTGQLSVAVVEGPGKDGASTIPIRDVQVASDGPGTITVTIDDARIRGRYFINRHHVHVWLGSGHYDLLVDDPRQSEFSASASAGGLTTPLPGVVVAVAVKPGQVVSAGEVLMVIEAMKMEHSITAPHAGTVKAVNYAKGDRVPEGSALLELEGGG